MYTQRGASRGFTLVEILFSLLVVFLLMGMLIVGIRYATSTTRKALDTQAVAALKMGVDQFKQRFGFPPPLVKDQGDPPSFPGTDPLTGVPPSIPRVYSPSVPADLAYLRYDANTPPTPADQRFSIYSLAYYVIGALEKDADGVQGPGFTEPRRDGSFSRRGATYGPYFDTGRNPRAIFAADAVNGRVELRDSNGVAFRYYRWLPDAGSMSSSNPANEYLNVPLMVGDPLAEPRVRNAAYAIVGAGRNGLFGDEYLLAGHPQFVPLGEMESRLGLPGGSTAAEVTAKAMADNVVEVGR